MSPVLERELSVCRPGSRAQEKPVTETYCVIRVIPDFFEWGSPHVVLIGAGMSHGGFCEAVASQTRLSLATGVIQRLASARRGLCDDLRK